MYVLRIETQHAPAEFDAWKQRFDRDPLGRARGGVRRHRVLRTADESGTVLIDLEFDSAGQAESFLAALRDFWGHDEVGHDHTHAGRIAELVETKDY
jgi:hypothetical protein